LGSRQRGLFARVPAYTAAARRCVLLQRDEAGGQRGKAPLWSVAGAAPRRFNACWAASSAVLAPMTWRCRRSHALRLRLTLAASHGHAARGGPAPGSNECRRAPTPGSPGPSDRGPAPRLRRHLDPPLPGRVQSAVGHRLLGQLRPADPVPLGRPGAGPVAAGSPVTGACSKQIAAALAVR
jgi:hypothetical protein